MLIFFELWCYNKDLNSYFWERYNSLRIRKSLYSSHLKSSLLSTSSKFQQLNFIRTKYSWLSGKRYLEIILQQRIERHILKLKHKHKHRPGKNSYLTKANELKKINWGQSHGSSVKLSALSLNPEHHWSAPPKQTNKKDKLMTYK